MLNKNSQSRAKIIWVDDEIDMLKSHILFLEKKGYFVSGVNSAEDALEKLKIETFDILFLDENMNGMDGITALKEIKSKYVNLPVIMITKNEEEWLMDEAIGYKADSFLTKPVNPSQILLACKEILDSSKIFNDKVSEKYLNDFQNLNSKIQNANSIEDWYKINDIFCDWIIKLEEIDDKNLIEIFNDQYSISNKYFADFIVKNYKLWINEDKRPTLSNDIVKDHISPLLHNDEKVVFIVLDCLSVDLWKKISSLLYNYYNIENNNVLSILPTATPFSRNAIFSGLFPNELLKRFPNEHKQMWSDQKSRNRFEDFFLKKQISRFGFKNKKIKYEKIITLDQGKKMVSNLNDYKAFDLFSIVINFIDILGHSRSESDVLKEIITDRVSYRSAIVNWFENAWLLELLKEISWWGHKVIITSDHGMLQVNKSVLVKGDKTTSTGLRYKYGRNLNISSKKGLVIKNPSEYKLPNFDNFTNYIIAKENNFFIYPNHSNLFTSNFQNSFQHGGISLDEMIVPLAILDGKNNEKHM